MSKEQDVEFIKRALYRSLAVMAVVRPELVKEAGPLPLPAPPSEFMNHIAKGLKGMGTDVGSLLSWALLPGLVGAAAGAGAERLTSPPTVDIKNSRKKELLDAYDRALVEVQSRLEEHRRRASYV